MENKNIFSADTHPPKIAFGLIAHKYSAPNQRNVHKEATVFLSSFKFCILLFDPWKVEKIFCKSGCTLITNQRWHLNFDIGPGNFKTFLFFLNTRVQFLSYCCRTLYNKTQPQDSDGNFPTIAMTEKYSAEIILSQARLLES